MVTLSLSLKLPFNLQKLYITSSSRSSQDTPAGKSLSSLAFTPYLPVLTNAVCYRWIGNAAEDGIMATVFARLKVPAADGSSAIDDQGVHAFIVPLRDPETKQLLPGVEIHDNAYKVDLLFVAQHLG